MALRIWGRWRETVATPSTTSTSTTCSSSPCCTPVASATTVSLAGSIRPDRRPAARPRARWLSSYEIAQHLEQAGLGEVKGGTLYPRLSAMETAGLVEVEWRAGDNGPGRKYYRLTPAGRSAQQEAAAEFRRFATVALALVEGTPVPPPPPPTGPPLAGDFVNLEEIRR
ncbi:MAG: PadR family transcriptional regulator [Acidimicrobiales bacterium]